MSHPDLSPSPDAGAESESVREKDRLNNALDETGRRKTKIEKEKALLETRVLLAELDFLEAKIAITRTQTTLTEPIDELQKQVDRLVSSVEWAVISREGDDRNKLIFYTPATARRLLKGSGYKMDLYETPTTIEKAMKMANAEKANGVSFGRDHEVRRMTLPDFDSTYVEDRPASRFEGRI